MEKRYNTNWYMTLMFMLSMVVSLSFSACSDDDKNSSEQDMINTYVTKFQEQISEMAALRDDSPYGLQQGMYPEESKDILNSAIKKLEQVIENLSNGSYVEPAKSKFEQLLAETKRAIANFKESIRTTDYVDPNEDYELYVNGHQGGYIDFGVSPNFSRFGSEGQQTFTIELWMKVKSQEGFGSVISTFVEKGDDNDPNHYRKGWCVNLFDQKSLRMTYASDNWNLMEPGLEFNTLNEWVHFAAVMNEKGFNGETNGSGSPIICKIYLNGELKTTRAKSDMAGNYTSNTLENTAMVAFGQMDPVSGIKGDRNVEGYIKHFHIWKSAKSESDIKKLAQYQLLVTGDESDLVCGWPFNRLPDDFNNVEDLTGRYFASLKGNFQWVNLK